MNPVFSVIIPVKNGSPYIQYCMESVLSSSWEGLEIIVSVDDSTDSSQDIVESFVDERVRVVYPPKGLSMSEHWDFAQAHASGDWQMFLGQDDLLMINFDNKLKKLIQLAEDLGQECVVARRAYVNWPEVNSRKTPAIQIWGTETVRVEKSHDFILAALRTSISYHAGPQAYTSSFASSRSLSAIRSRNSGRLIAGHPQDAFLAAELLSNQESFIRFGGSFSLVGTSRVSAGLAISSGSLKQPSSNQNLAKEYLTSVNSSQLRGGTSLNFLHGSSPRYFLSALEEVNPHFVQTIWPTLANRLLFDARVLESNPLKKVRLDELNAMLRSPLSDRRLIWLYRWFPVQRKILTVAKRLLLFALKPMISKKLSFTSLKGPASEGEILTQLARFG